MTELRTAIGVAHEIEGVFSGCAAPETSVDGIITADRRALVDAIVAMLRKEAGDVRTWPDYYASQFADLIAQRFGKEQ